MLYPGPPDTGWYSPFSIAEGGMESTTQSFGAGENAVTSSFINQGVPFIPSTHIPFIQSKHVFQVAVSGWLILSVLPIFKLSDSQCHPSIHGYGFIRWNIENLPASTSSQKTHSPKAINVLQLLRWGQRLIRLSPIQVGSTFISFIFLHYNFLPPNPSIYSSLLSFKLITSFIVLSTNMCAYKHTYP